MVRWSEIGGKEELGRQGATKAPILGMLAGLVDPPSGRGYILADVRAPYSMAVFFSHFEGAVALKKAMKIKNHEKISLADQAHA